MIACDKSYELKGLKRRCQRPKRHKGSHGPFRPKLKDQDGTKLSKQDKVIFIADTGLSREGTVIGRDQVDFDRVSVIIDGDPFPVGIKPINLRKKGSNAMPATTQDKVAEKRELRTAAKVLKIKGYKEMSLKELRSAVAGVTTNGKTAKVPRGHTKADKGKPVTPSQKKAAGKADKTTKASKTAKRTRNVTPTISENGNPFRPGTNNYLITEEMIKGGVRSKIISRLLKKITFKPWAKTTKEIDPSFEMDKRILMATHQLQHKHGFTVVHFGGRGADKASVRVFPPGTPVPKELKARATRVNLPGTPPRPKKATKVEKAAKTATKATKAPAKKASKTTAKAKKKTSAKK